MYAIRSPADTAGTAPAAGAVDLLLPAAAERAAARPILFVDGHCVLCQRTARWVMRRDRRGRIALAALQGSTARRLLPPALRGEAGAQPELGAGGRAPPAPASPGSLVWREVDGQLRIRSSAVLAAAAALGGRYRAGAALLRLVPAPLRDAVYLALARRRRRWFGATDHCRLPAAADRGRVLD